MISNRLAMLGTRNIVYTLYELQLQASNEFIRFFERTVAVHNNLLHVIIPCNWR